MRKHGGTRATVERQRNQHVIGCLERGEDSGTAAGAMQNEVPFREIEAELWKAGYQRTYKQCCNKIKALKKQYKEVVDRWRKSGAGCESDDENLTASDFKWFAEIHRVMKKRAVVRLCSCYGCTQPYTRTGRGGQRG